MRCLLVGSLGLSLLFAGCSDAAFEPASVPASDAGPVGDVPATPVGDAVARDASPPPLDTGAWLPPTDTGARADSPVISDTSRPVATPDGSASGDVYAFPSIDATSWDVPAYDASAFPWDAFVYDVAPLADVPPADTGAPADLGPTDASVGEGGGDGGATVCDLITDREPVTLYLSADDSNSMAAATIARRMIRNRQVPPLAVLRTYEFLNYYNVPYEPAPAGTVRVVPQLAPGDAPGRYELQVGVQSERRTTEQVRPLNLTLVLDTSGSMSVGGRIERERAVVRALAGHLRRGDVVSAVTWNTERRVALSGYRVTGPSDPTLLSLAASLDGDGGTDLHSALVQGYELALANFSADRLNRVVLVSDGEANVGVTDASLIARESHRAEGEELYLVGVGVGDGFNDTLMDTVTDRGRGAYLFIDSDAEAEAMFGQRFEEVLDLAVRAVRLEVTLPWYMKVAEFHGEVISTDPREVDPQHLAPNDAMVFHSVLRACAPSVVSLTDPVVFRATYDARVGRAPGSETVRTTFAALLDGSRAELLRGSAIVAYAEALKTAATALGSWDPATARTSLTRARTVVAAARAASDDAALREIDELLVAYLAYAR